MCRCHCPESTRGKGAERTPLPRPSCRVGGPGPVRRGRRRARRGRASERLGLLALDVEVLEQATDRGAVDDERDDAHRGATKGAQQRIELVDLADELRPGETPALWGASSYTFAEATWSQGLADCRLATCRCRRCGCSRWLVGGCPCLAWPQSAAEVPARQAGVLQEVRRAAHAVAAVVEDGV